VTVRPAGVPDRRQHNASDRDRRSTRRRQILTPGLFRLGEGRRACLSSCDWRCDDRAPGAANRAVDRLQFHQQWSRQKRARLPYRTV